MFPSESLLMSYPWSDPVLPVPMAHDTFWAFTGMYRVLKMVKRTSSFFFIWIGCEIIWMGACKMFTRIKAGINNESPFSICPCKFRQLTSSTSQILLPQMCYMLNFFYSMFGWPIHLDLYSIVWIRMIDFKKVIKSRPRLFVPNGRSNSIIVQLPFNTLYVTQKYYKWHLFIL